MKLRNDDNHGRLAQHHVTPELIAKAEAALQALYQSTEFLTDYRLILITRTRVSIDPLPPPASSDVATMPAASLMDKQNRTISKPTTLYLRDRQGALQLLRPLLQYLQCPECHQMSTFFLDTYDGTGGNIVGIKCFERNTSRREPIANDFRHVGLLR